MEAKNLVSSGTKEHVLATKWLSFCFVRFKQADSVSLALAWRQPDEADVLPARRGKSTRATPCPHPAGHPANHHHPTSTLRQPLDRHGLHFRPRPHVPPPRRPVRRGRDQHAPIHHRCCPRPSLLRCLQGPYATLPPVPHSLTPTQPPPTDHADARPSRDLACRPPQGARRGQVVGDPGALAVPPPPPSSPI